MPGDVAVDATHDELAGVVDMFGGLTREELRRALSEVAFRRDGQTLEREAMDEAVAEAVDAYALVRYERGDDDPLLVPGPTAFPAIPVGAEDLPHILDVEPRDVDRDAVGDAVADRLREDAATAIGEGDDDRIDALLDVCYDTEAWGPVELDDVRDRLDEARDGG